jgi:hypothetical protein
MIIIVKFRPKKFVMFFQKKIQFVSLCWNNIENL